MTKWKNQNVKTKMYEILSALNQENLSRKISIFDLWLYTLIIDQFPLLKSSWVMGEEVILKACGKINGKNIKGSHTL